jgi:pimeloyl-ACP methyl ester carboxylesterase
MTSIPSLVRADDGADRFADLPGGFRICYRCFGEARDKPVLLIAGLGLQLISWPDSFIAGLVAQGHFVIAPDNRDAGRSSNAATPPPGRLRQLMGWPPAENYSLDDMADDMVRLVRHLALARVHLVGMSMGGMIIQTIAARHPERVHSLTSIFSTTGAAGVGQPERSTLLKLARSAPRNVDESARGYADLMMHIGNPAVPGIEAVWEAYARRAWERGGNRANASGMARQIAAIQKSGDRTAQLKRIQAPTLVLHGDLDRIVAPSGGAATARAIDGARLVTIPGMRHQIDDQCGPTLLAHMLPHLRQAEENPCD